MAEFLEYPLAYHITFGTYGMRLHGGEQATVSRNQNQFGEPIIGRDIVWERLDRSLMEFPSLVLTDAQRRVIEEIVPTICVRGKWEYHIAAAQSDHLHVMLSSTNEGKRVRQWLKRWLGEGLSKQWPQKTLQTWWAIGGSVKSIWNEEYFTNVFEYIRRQRTTPFSDETNENRK